MWIYPKVFITIFNWKVSVYGESRTHGLEGAVEGRPSTATLPINTYITQLNINKNLVFFLFYDILFK